MQYYHIDSFTQEVFKGNPAGVCMLNVDAWPSDSWMLSIASENRHSETAFVLKKDGEFHIRWFSPLAEVYLCGHATLAAAYALFFQENIEQKTIVFHSSRGRLIVTRNGQLLTMDFPINPPRPVAASPLFKNCFDIPPLEVYQTESDFLFVYADEDDITNIGVHLDQIAKLPSEGVIITAPSEKYDFVSRCFCPQVGIDEDPVTGSAHTILVPYWHKRLQKNTFMAKQLSERSGEIICRLQGERVLLSGYAKLYLKGQIFAEPY